MKLALMVIDLQKAYYNGTSKASMDSAVEYIDAILPWFREKNYPIIWVQDADVESGVVEGTEGFDFIDSLTPLPGEHRVTKSYNNSFNKTTCASILEAANIDTVLITGYCAEYCIYSTYIGAKDLDLTPILLKNGVASGHAEHLKMIEEICDHITYGALKKAMDI